MSLKIHSKTSTARREQVILGSAINELKKAQKKYKQQYDYTKIIEACKRKRDATIPNK